MISTLDDKREARAEGGRRFLILVMVLYSRHYHFLYLQISSLLKPPLLTLMTISYSRYLRLDISRYLHFLHLMTSSFLISLDISALFLVWGYIKIGFIDKDMNGLEPKIRKRRSHQPYPEVSSSRGR